jgi:hypothetical protein
MRYEHRLYATKSGLRKAIKRWGLVLSGGLIVHYHETTKGWTLLRRLA